MEIVSGWGSPRIGICWNPSHDARNGSLVTPPAFISCVRCVQLRDIAPEGEKHSPARGPLTRTANTPIPWAATVAAGGIYGEGGRPAPTSQRTQTICTLGGSEKALLRTSRIHAFWTGFRFEGDCCSITLLATDGFLEYNARQRER